MLLHLCQVHQAREDVCEGRGVRTNQRNELETQGQTNHSGPRRLQDSHDLQKKQLFFVTELTTHLAQEKDHPQELGADREGVTEKSAYPPTCCSFVVRSTLPACSEDLLFDLCVLKFQGADKPPCTELEQRLT